MEYDLLQQKLNKERIRAEQTLKILENYSNAWQNSNGEPLSDLELRIPGVGIGRSRLDIYSAPVTENSKLIEEKWGIQSNEDFQSMPEITRERISHAIYGERIRAKRDYLSRKMNRFEFEGHLKSAVKTLREKSPLFGRCELEDLESQLAEHLATPYDSIPIGYYKIVGKAHPSEREPSRAKTLTKKQWRQHLRGMQE